MTHEEGMGRKRAERERQRKVEEEGSTGGEKREEGDSGGNRGRGVRYGQKGGREKGRREWEEEGRVKSGGG